MLKQKALTTTQLSAARVLRRQLAPTDIDEAQARLADRGLSARQHVEFTRRQLGSDRRSQPVDTLAPIDARRRLQLEPPVPADVAEWINAEDGGPEVRALQATSTAPGRS